MKLKRKVKKKFKKSKRKSREIYTHEKQTHLIARVQEIAGPLCDGQGIELVHIEYVSEQEGLKLRLYIDKPGGVQLGDCAMFSRELSDLLDINLGDDVGTYNLEVSSPGFDRPLAKLSDFERFKGNAVKIKTSSAIDGQKNFKGTLVGTAPGAIKLKVNGKVVQIPFQEIARARLNPN